MFMANKPTRSRRPLLALLPLLIAPVLALSGCVVFYRAPVLPPQAGTFTNTGQPVDIDFDNTIIGHRRGEASSVSIIGLFGFGDCTVASAAREGNIDVVDHIDGEVLNILGLYTRMTTIVYGRSSKDLQE